MLSKGEPVVVRFSSLKPYSEQHASSIPVRAMEAIAARRVYPIMVPTDYKGRSQNAPIRAGAGAILSIAECPPGNGPALHIHEQAVENFLCLSGKFEVSWGTVGQSKVVLEPLDFVSIPAGIYRSFRNVSGETARLFALIQPIKDGEQEDRVMFAPQIADDIKTEFGEEVLEAFRRIGMTFSP
jgi:quercetin dioxygenase-like cupin family protein